MGIQTPPPLPKISPFHRISPSSRHPVRPLPKQNPGYDQLSCARCTRGIWSPDFLLILIPDMKPTLFLLPANVQMNSPCKKFLTTSCFRFQSLQKAICFSNLIHPCARVLSLFLSSILLALPPCLIDARASVSWNTVVTLKQIIRLKNLKADKTLTS